MGGSGAGMGVWCIPGGAGDLCPGAWCCSLYGHGVSTIDCGCAFVNNIESLNLNVIAGCFLVGVGFLGHGGLGAWFLNHSISCPKQMNLKITFIV